MVKIERNKIVGAAVGSTRLEDYKGSLKTATSKKIGTASAKTKAKVTAKH